MTPTLLGDIPASVADAVGLASSIATLLCVAPLVYLTWIRHPDGRPSPVTWSTWFAVDLVATLGMALGGAPFSAWVLQLGLSLGPLVVAAVALHRGVAWRATKLDRWSLGLAAVGLTVYVLVYFGAIGPADPVTAGIVAVVVAMLVDAIGAGPTWYQAWTDPREPAITYVVAWFAVAAVLLTLPLPWTFLSAAYLVFLAVQMLSIIAALRAGRGRARRRITLGERS